MIRVATLSSLFVLAGCGLTGDLERPPPLWGDPGKSGVEAAVPIEDNTERIGEGTSVFETEDDLLGDPDENITPPDETDAE